MSERYVLSLRKTGLGDRLISLCAAWIYARATRRTLIVDWRHAQYLPGGMNLFPYLFEATSNLAGVNFICDASLNTAGLPLPTHPKAWGRPDLLASPWQAASDAFPLERANAIEMIRNGIDVPAPTVVFNACLDDAVENFADAAEFFGGLRPNPSLVAQASVFEKANLDGAPWIGLHIRHGNGGNIMGHAPAWRSFGAGIERCQRAVAFARNRVGHAAPVFLCTDSLDVEAEIQASVPHVITRSKTFRPSGAGELHLGAEATSGLQDAAIEMLILARSHVLIRYPAKSFFSIYPAVIKPRTSPVPLGMQELCVPFDSANRLTPSVLF